MLSSFDAFVVFGVHGLFLRLLLLDRAGENFLKGYSRISGGKVIEEMVIFRTKSKTGFLFHSDLQCLLNCDCKPRARLQSNTTFSLRG